VGRLHLSGFFAWMAWSFIHIVYLIGFRNRVLVFIQWVWSYIRYRRGARLITEHEWKLARERAPQPSAGALPEAEPARALPEEAEPARALPEEAEPARALPEARAVERASA
jgi:NADH dehydrogenase